MTRGFPADDDFAEFAAAELPRLLRLARVITGSADDAWDLTQECLVQVGLHWGRTVRSGSPPAYARKTLVNCSKNLFRSNARRRTREQRYAAERAAGDSRETELPRWLEDGLAELPVQQRAAVALRYLENLSDAEIGTILGCSATTVRSHVSRGLERLRRRSDGQQ